VSARLKLDETEAQNLERWYSNFERVGTIGEKCRELGITPHTLYDTVRRVRGELTRTTREKLSTEQIDALTTEILAGTSNVEPAQTLEEQLDTTEPT